MKTLIRLDVALVEQGTVASRTQAQELISNGLVKVAGSICKKPGTKIELETEIEILGELHPYVSRGGVKLEGALARFAIDVHGFVALDIGAGTGGFTDCLLQRGAKKVYCVDVGSAQLHEKLRHDSRVVFEENCHIKEFSPTKISDTIDIIVVDLSFISLTKIVRYIKEFAVVGTQLIALFKPQFEVGKEFVGKKGIVKKDAPMKEKLEQVSQQFTENGFAVKGSVPAQISGGDGNQEYLIYAVYE